MIVARCRCGLARSAFRDRGTAFVGAQQDGPMRPGGRPAAMSAEVVMPPAAMQLAQEPSGSERGPTGRTVRDVGNVGDSAGLRTACSSGCGAESAQCRRCLDSPCRPLSTQQGTHAYCARASMALRVRMARAACTAPGVAGRSHRGFPGGSVRTWTAVPCLLRLSESLRIARCVAATPGSSRSRGALDVAG